MSCFPYFSVVVDFPLAVGARRYDRDAAASFDVAADRVAIVSLVGKQEAPVYESAYGIHRADTVVIVPADQPHAQRQPDHVHGSGYLRVATASGFAKLLILNGKRMLRGVLVSLDVLGVEHHRDGEVAVPVGDAFEDPRPHSAFAPTSETSPDAVVLAEPAGKLVPHRTGAQNPPDTVESTVDALVRTTATAAYFFAVSVVNFWGCPS
ncbi:hypothetical protein QEH53_19560 [Pelagicoccus sp. SDUM812002]|nr:hypothetical protein [Pelagicoccus sp. SDUM812002]MDQ8187796.1 hypothetical protein [Pelagicoccus sp. SDUM812002]